MLKHLFRAAALTFALATPALSACVGTDVRESFTAAERAQLAEALDATPYAEGNHWIARRGTEVVHFVGTLHLDDPRLDGVMTRLAPVLDGAGQVLMEMTPDEQAQLKSAIAKDTGLILIEDGPTLIEQMGDDWAMIAEAAQARGIPPFMAAKMEPWYLAVMLSLPACAREKMIGGAHGLDARIMKHAEENALKMTALEPYDTLFRLFTSVSMEEQIEMLRAGVPPEAEAANALVTMLDLYFAEESGAIWPINVIHMQGVLDQSPEETAADVESLREVVLAGRNAAWLPHILEAAGAKPVVVAVGAGHLSGSDGLLKMMEDKGFALERAPF